MSKKQLSFTFFILITFLIAILSINSLPFTSDKESDKTYFALHDVLVTINDVTTIEALPLTLYDIAPATPITISAHIDLTDLSSMYIKSVYTTTSLYLDDDLVYNYGAPDTYPDFMLDPPCTIDIIDLPEFNSSLDLRLEYISPNTRTSFTIYPPYFGEYSILLQALRDETSFSFSLSIFQLFLGLILLIITTFVVSLDKLGSIYLWLSFSTISSGLWGIGETDITALYIHNPTLLYLFTHVGLFVLPIPLLLFCINLINFKHKSIPITLVILLEILVCIMLVLQILGIYALSSSLFIMQLFLPFILILFTFLIFYEGVHYKSVSARVLFIPMTILAVASMLELLNYTYNISLPFSTISQIGVLLFIIPTGISTGYYIHNSILVQQRKSLLEHKVSSMEHQLVDQRKYFESLIDNTATLKKQKHDLRHQLILMQDLNTKNQTDELAKLLQDITNSIPSLYEHMYCENIAVNAVVTHYAKIALTNDINTNIRLVIPSQLPGIIDSDLCILVGNMFENAIEACLRMSSEDLFINISSVLHNNIFTIIVDNSFNGQVKKSNNLFISSKRNDYGTGTTSIKSIAASYNGNAVFEHNKNIWKSSAYISLKNTE
ncbi:MAG: GHKL domain-containing protein [Lachnospiraceae bacterium]